MNVAGECNKFQNYLQRATSPKMLAASVTYQLRLMGFNDFTLHDLNKQPTPKTTVRVVYEGKELSPTYSRRELITTMPEEMLDAYYEKEFPEHDIIMDYGRHNDEPIFLSELHQDIDTLPPWFPPKFQNKEIREFYLTHGIKEMCLIPYQSETCRFMLTLIDKGGDQNFDTLVNQNWGPLAEFVKAIDNIGIDKFREAPFDQNEKRTVNLTDRQFKLLTLMACNDMSQSKSAKEIGISTYQACRLLLKVKEELGVKTINGVFYHVTKLGLLDERDIRKARSSRPEDT
ncbi:MAG: autoinducer binding domain-containing protein [Kordiimonadaceae bacterium]|nr:autoinducer binding domain-containing protein [Kordiimonadaceae bacterium]